MTAGPAPPLILPDATDDPEFYELLGSKWVRKESVGRKEHSKMGRILFGLLLPFAEQYDLMIETEWTIVQGERKIIPDVTVSRPQPQIHDDYLVAPALLAVETRSRGQRLQTLIDKCLVDHHAMGTPYCWILDIDEELGYECHREIGKAVVAPTLSLGNYSLPIELRVKNIFEAFHQKSNRSCAMFNA